MEMKRNEAAVLPANLEEIAARYHRALRISAARAEAKAVPKPLPPETARLMEEAYYGMLDQAVLYQYIARLAAKNSDRMVLASMRKEIETAAGVLYTAKAQTGLTEHMTERYGAEKYRFRFYCAGLRFAERRLVTMIDNLVRLMQRRELDKTALVAACALLYRQTNQLSYLLRDCIK